MDNRKFQRPIAPRFPRRRPLLPAEETYQHPNRPKWFLDTPFDRDFVFFDLETTGGGVHNASIIEVAAIKYSNGVEVGRYESLVNPRRFIPRIVVNITGINAEMVKDAPSIRHVIKEFVDFIGDGVLVAHGVLNDYAFVSHAAQQYLGKQIENYHICTHLLVENIMPSIPVKKLTGVADYFGYTPSGAHRAMADAETTAFVFWSLYNVCEEMGFTTIESLLKIQSDNQTVKRLGSGLLEKELEKAPNVTGVYYLVGGGHEITYVSASPNIKKSVLDFKALTADREINRILVDAQTFKAIPTPTYLEALLEEKELLKKISLSIDPRRYEGRKSSYLQVFIPDDMLLWAKKNPSAFPFLLPAQETSKNASIFDPTRYRAENDEFFSYQHAQPSGLENFPTTEQVALEGDTSHVPVRRVRIMSTLHRTHKYSPQARERNEAGECWSLGALKWGQGWFFGPVESPDEVRALISELTELFPYDDTTLPMAERVENLRIIIHILFGNIGFELNRLQDELLGTPKWLRPIRYTLLKKRVAALVVLAEKDKDLSADAHPKQGLTIITNNEGKVFDVYVVVGGRIQKKIKLPYEQAEKLKSPRWFTRLFVEFHEHLANPMQPFHFDNDFCADVEVFSHWLQKRNNEGEWVDFEELDALYNPSIL